MLIQRAVRSLDPALPRPAVTTLRKENAIVLLPQRVAAIVTGALGAVGLLLASVGLYEIVAYSTNRRTRLIAGFLFGVSPLDAGTFVAMSTLFVAVAMVASYLPARRAAAADPVLALRAE